VSGDNPLDNTQQALDAAFTVNGLAVTSASNTVTDAVPGVTLTLSKKDPATTVTVSVAKDETKAKDTLKKFINAYNDITTFAKDQNAAALAGRDSIGRDPLLRGLKDRLRQTMMAEHTGGTLKRLAEIGVGFDMTGKMVLDEELFDEKFSASQTDVQTLVSGAAGDAGAFKALKDVVDDYTIAGGLVGDVRERIDQQIGNINKRLDTLEAQLEVRRQTLQREYMAADLAMTRLKSQSASLSSAGGGYRLF
jgi:flagellar hook-associated protein 2